MSEILHGLTEKPGVNRNFILLATTSFIALLVAGAAIAWLAFREPIRDEMAEQSHFSVSTFAQPRLKTAPNDALNVLRSHEDRMLNSYEWVDKKRQMARIPVSRAMELTLRKQLLGGEVEHAR